MQIGSCKLWNVNLTPKNVFRSHMQVERLASAPPNPQAVVVAEAPGVNVSEELLKPRAKRKFLIVIEGNQETGFGALMPDVPGIFFVGSTKEEILGYVEEALLGYIEYLEADGKVVIPKERTTSEMESVINSSPHEELSFIYVVV